MKTLRQSKLRIGWAKEKLEYIEFARERVWKDALNVAADTANPDTRELLHLLQDNLLDETVKNVSEFIHHIRCALDYPIFIFAGRDGKEKFRPDKDRTQFPIYETPEEFVANGKGMLPHFTDEHVAEIERCQPYRGFHSLPLLNRLSNLDKHRESVHVSIMLKSVDLPLVTQTETPSLDASRAQMQVRSYFDPLILLTDGSDVKEALSELVSQVNKIVEQLDRVLG